METGHKTSKMHPLTAAAAIAVILVCLAGIAAMMGILPNFKKDPPAQAIHPAPPPATASAVAAAPATPPAAEEKAPPVVRKKPAKKPAPAASTKPTYQNPPVKSAAVSCHNCGVVESVRAVEQQAPASGIGAGIGAVVGGVLGNQVGSGTGRTLATIAGAVGGGYAGNVIEKKRSTTTSYEVVVRLNDGTRQRFMMGEARWRPGDLVRVEGGSLIAR